MVKLNSLNGSENLPQKKKIHPYDIENGFKSGHEDIGFNFCVDSLHSIELTGDEKVLEELILLKLSQMLVSNITDHLGFTLSGLLSEAIITSIPSWVRLTKGKYEKA